jgi:hypothetical protein
MSKETENEYGAILYIQYGAAHIIIVERKM